MDFRLAAGKQLSWRDTRIAARFSNFLFIDEHYGSNPVLRRIFSLARKHEYQSVVIDEIAESDCELLARENEALAVRRPDFQRSEVHRISFFKSLAQQTPVATDFLGYVVFKRDVYGSQAPPMVHVFESVMPPVRGAAQNNFVHCRRNYGVTTSVGRFAVTGVLYAQQNSNTFVCAHVGLRTVLASVLADGDITYVQMNALVGIDHKQRQVGNGLGLSPRDIEEILLGLGLAFEKVVHEPSQQLHLPTEYQRDLYGSIESGMPALIGFELDGATGGTGTRHAIPVFGHTFNEDTWLPQAQRAYFGERIGYYPSENWMSTFVVHDDNFGPYLCLPRHFLKKDNFRVMYGLKRCATTFNAVQAEAIGFALLDAIARRQPRTGNDWYDRFSVFTRRNWLVLRTLLVKKADYMGHLALIRDWEGRQLENEVRQHFETQLPPVFWLVEASAPELFNASRRKFGEILLPIDIPPKPLNAALMLAARVPGMIYFRSEQLKSQFDVRLTQLGGHTCLFDFPSSEFSP